MDNTAETTSTSLEERDLEFLRDEGLEVLALYKRIREERKRLLVRDLMRAIVADQLPVEGRA